ncbi:serine protease [Photobacterium profundum]|uniref:trypsin-like peptidase domain-containing protein n=1 Tax=Photobacterium profundum TaxID=74109 RepID=UPI003D0FF123
MKHHALLFISLLFSGCSTNTNTNSHHIYHEYSIEKNMVQAKKSLLTISSLNSVYQNQVRIEVQLKNAVSKGLGVALDSKHIATAAHVVNYLTVGDEATVIYQPSVNRQPLEYRAKLIKLDEKADLAIMQLKKQKLPEFIIPKICKKSIGGAIVNGGKPTGPHKKTGARLFSGINTNITTMPLVTKKANAKYSESGYPPRHQYKLEKRIIITNNSVIAGNSGGAIFDVERNCVIAIASMTATFDTFEDKESLKLKIDRDFENNIDSKSWRVLTAVPIQLYIQKLKQ